MMGGGWATKRRARTVDHCGDAPRGTLRVLGLHEGVPVEGKDGGAAMDEADGTEA